MIDARADVLREALVGWFARRAPSHADDLAQDTLVRILGALPTWRDDTRLDALVARARWSVWVDHLRSRRAHEPEVEVPVASPPSDEELALVASWLPAFVERLPEPYREAVRLADLEGVPQSVLAERLALSSSGARARVQRGRQLLRGELEACCRIGWEEGEVTEIEGRCGCVAPVDPETPAASR